MIESSDFSAGLLQGATPVAVDPPVEICRRYSLA
jgi:hypothetical protein